MESTYPTRSSVSATVDRLYTVFSGYSCDFQQLREIERAVEFGDPPEYTDRLSRTLLSRQRAEDLFPVLRWMALTGDQESASVRHILPRLFEITINDEQCPWEPALLGERLQGLGWEAWPAPERRAIQNILRKWLRWALHDPSVPWLILDAALEVNQVLLPDSITMGAFLRADPEGRFRARLMQVVRQTCNPTRWDCAIWDTTLAKYLIEEDTLDALEDAFFGVPEPEADELSAVLDIIRWYWGTPR